MNVNPYESPESPSPPRRRVRSGRFAVVQHILAAIGILSLAQFVALWITPADPYSYLLATAALALMMLIAYSMGACINAARPSRVVLAVLLGVSIGGLLDLLVMYFGTTIGNF